MDKFGFKRLAAPRILEIEAELIARGINFDMPRVPEKYDTGFIYLDLDSAGSTPGIEVFTRSGSGPPNRA